MADSPESERVYDVVVVGTGLTESLFAGACARNGKRVLHLDHHAHYGSRSASFNLSQFDSWLRGLGPEGKDDAGLADGRGPFVDGAIRITPVSDAPRDVSFTGAAEGLTETGAHPGMTAAALGELHRYSIDLTPQLLLCGGPMVDTLRSSGVASYLEFKPMQSHLYGRIDGLERVPCSKGEIFSSPSLGLVEKRQLMRFLQTCAALQPKLEPEITPPPQALAAPDAAVPAPSELGGSFVDFAIEQRLSPALRQMALYAILNLPRPVTSRDPGPSAADGVRLVCRHLRSLGVYGPTAYLESFYGCGELPQAFCRLCAVWGGTYMLQRSACALVLGEGGRVDGIVDADGSQVKCDWLVLNADSRVGGAECGGAEGAGRPAATEGGAEGSEGGDTVARGVFVLDGPLLGDGEELTVAVVNPPDDGTSSVSIKQLDASAAVCPRGKVLLHMSAMATAGVTPRDQLEPLLQALMQKRAAQALGDAVGDGAEAGSTPPHAAEVGAEVPRVLWGVYFALPVRRCELGSMGLPPNLLVCDDPPLSLCCDDAVQKAKELFDRVCPGEPFLPPRDDDEAPGGRSEDSPA